MLIIRIEERGGALEFGQKTSMYIHKCFVRQSIALRMSNRSRFILGSLILKQWLIKIYDAPNFESVKDFHGAAIIYYLLVFDIYRQVGTRMQTPIQP